MTGDLPPVDTGVPKTLVIYYKDGSELKVPYFSHAGAKAFLDLEREHIKYFETVSYTGE